MNISMRRSGVILRLWPTAAGVCLALVVQLGFAAGASHPNASTDPTDVPQVTADPPLRVPATASCTETVLVHTFANSYYAPGYGQHSASACPGPWSFVALSATVSTSGVQFDRLFDIYVGNVPLLSSSTSEPSSEVPGAITHWEVDSDVSRFAGLLASDQPITALLANVNDSTYTGQYAVTLTLTFYAVGANAPAIVAPDYIGAVFDPDSPPHQDGPSNNGMSGYAGLGANNTTYSKSLTLPTNLLTLSADVYAEGHGACEEFWWAEPGQCGVGTPLRQVVLSIDGVIAGFAAVYPVVFTGGGGPGLWEPIPSPRAWHLDPYRLDLTPFIGLLVDGQPHRFTIDVPDAAYSDPGDYWVVGATLLGSTDPVLTQTHGALTSAPVAASATETDMSDPTNTATVQFTGSRDGSWTGYVIGSAGRVDTVVTNHLDITSSSAEAVTSTWNWNTSSKVTTGSAAAVTTTHDKTYKLNSTILAGGTYSDSGTTTIDGPNPFSSSYDLELETVGNPEINTTEVETYNGSDSTGYCYQRVINAAAGYIVSDQTLPMCIAATTGTTSGGSTGGSTSGSSSGGSTGGSTSGGSSGGSTGGSTTGGATTGDTTGSTSGGSTGGSTGGGTSGGSTTGASTTGGSTTGNTTGGSTTGMTTGSVAPSPAVTTPVGDSRFGGAFGLPGLSMLLLLAAARRRQRTRRR